MGSLVQATQLGQLNHPPPGYTWTGVRSSTVPTVGQTSSLLPGVQKGFQGMTVQQLLEAQFRVIQQQFAAQREEVRLIQQQLKQQQYSQPPPMLVGGPPPVAGGLAWGYRPSC